MKDILFRHGDVNLIPIQNIHKEVMDKIGNILEKEYKEYSDLTIAYGEKTGHSHVATTTNPDDKFRVVESNGLRFFIVNDKPKVKLTHQQHGVLTLFPEIYVQGPERELDWFSNVERKVVD